MRRLLLVIAGAAMACGGSDGAIDAAVDTVASDSAAQDVGGGCQIDADCAHLGANRCLGPFTCAGGSCVEDESARVSCPVSPSPCIPNVCHPDTGACAARRLEAGTPCDADGDACTVDACDAEGACVFARAANDRPGCPAPCAGPGDCADADACTQDLCDAGRCAHPPVAGCVAPEACGEVLAMLSCEDVVGPADGLTSTMRSYDCLSAPQAGGELVYGFVAPDEGVRTVRLTVAAEPVAYARVLWLADTCDSRSCEATQALDAGAEALIVDVAPGGSYWVVVDAGVGGIVELASLWLSCTGGETCDDLEDDDFDDLVDCEDPECRWIAPCEAVEARCGDGFDNDADGRIDCLDEDCDGIVVSEAAGSPPCESAEATCTDGFDNDGDDDTDCDDADCFADAACTVACASHTVPVACGELLNHVSATAQTFASYGCLAGDWRVPELLFEFRPETAGTAHIGLALLHENAAVVLLSGGCEAAGCADAWPASTVAFHEPGSFAFEAGQTWIIAVDAGAVDGAFVDALVVDRFRLRCE